MVVGVLLVLGCALAFADASVHLGSREEVLVVAQPVSAGGTGTLTSGSPVDATVVGVDAAPPGSGSPPVFSLQVGRADAAEVASLAAAGEASLVEVGAGG